MRSPRQDGHWSAAAVTDAFPPTSAAEVLALCDGVWMSLRSTLQPADSDEGWHSSEKGELTLHWTAAGDHSALGTLDATPPSGITSRLTFLADGRLETCDGKQGRWELQANGRLVLIHSDGELRLEEAISFTKPNLRLRNLLIWKGEQLQGSQFCSEIRRVSKPSS